MTWRWSYFTLISNVVFQKFVSEIAAYGPAAIGSNPPWSPFFQRGNFFCGRFKPLFGKEGKGRFLQERRGNYAAKFRESALDGRCFHRLR